jgi:DNA adenine methylase
MKAFVRWQGNKSKHLNKIIKYIPDFSGTYIEPFVGSGAMLLKLQPKKWIINDINKDLINIWESIKEYPQEIIKIFKKFGKDFTRLSKEDKLKYCKEITSKIENLPYDIKRASIYMLMKQCVYMGNIIINNKFYFTSLDMNVYNKYYPFLKQKNYDNILEVSQFLNNSKGKIFNKNYEIILDKAKSGDFVFLDPPYVETNNYGFNYNKDEVLDEKFLNKLYQQVKKLNTRGVKWIMTQADTKQIKGMFKEYIIKKFQVYRAASKSYVNELIIMNYNTPLLL